jgi:hypothetical protein
LCWLYPPEADEADDEDRDILEEALVSPAAGSPEEVLVIELVGRRSVLMAGSASRAVPTALSRPEVE